jgi:uncharacterized SAM-binding protein YcdF (DUF218 family)
MAWTSWTGGFCSVCGPLSEARTGRSTNGARRRGRGLRALSLAPSVLAIALTLASPAAAANDAAVDGRVQALVALAMQSYWHGGDAKAAGALLKGVTLHGRYDVVQRAFADAAALAPSRLDLKFAVASTQLIQGNEAGARQTYAAILAQDPASFEAYAWLAALDRSGGDEAAAAGAEQAMAALDPVRAAMLHRRFRRVEDIVATPLGTTPRAFSGRLTIVTLGYALSPSGAMETPLVDRLTATLAAARANPSASILVTGGQPQAGVTEADVMMRWLVDHGVDRARIEIEDKARDTVGNALNSAVRIARTQPDRVLLVTSPSHMRRAQALMEAALVQEGLEVPLSTLAAPGDAVGPPSPNERLAIYRDVLRVSGVWAYPGLQR